MWETCSYYILLKECTALNREGLFLYNLRRIGKSYLAYKSIQLFRGCRTKLSAKVYVTMPRGFMGSRISFPWLKFIVGVSQKKACIRPCIHRFFFIGVKTTWTGKCDTHNTSRYYNVGFHNYAYAGQPFSKQLYIMASYQQM